MSPLSDDAEKDLFLVDSGITSLADVYLDIPHLESLNLHSNCIFRIENICCLTSLTTLDLSSNKIAKMEGLNYLKNLGHLNLACNLITIVEGLTQLCQLRVLNLSYNQVTNLSGLKRLPPSNSLTSIQLQGNKLSDMNHVIPCLRSCSQLTYVILDDGPSATNPVCQNLNYSQMVLSQIPSLKSTNKEDIIDQSSRSVLVDSEAEISALKATVVETPRIDAILQRFHNALDKQPMTERRALQTEPSSQSDTPESPIPGPDNVCVHEKRELQEKLANLEKQLLKKKIERMQVELESENEAKRPSQIPQRNKSAKRTSAVCVTDKKPISAVITQLKTTDSQHREAVSSTYQQLMKDLNAERGRREQAEEANSKLLQRISTMRTQSGQTDEAMRNCDDALRKLQREKMDYKEKFEKAKERVATCDAKCKETQMALKEATLTCAKQEKTIRKFEEIAERLESGRLNAEDKHAKEREALRQQLESQAEILASAQSASRMQQTELTEMRSLLASREADHRRDKENMYLLDSPKLEQLFQSKVSSLIRERETERREFESKLVEGEKAYTDLEDEFRLALTIEAERFQTLKDAFEQLSTTQSSQQKVLEACKEKDLRSAAMITDLTQNQITHLETTVKDLKQGVKDSERLKRDNLELKNQVQGQHSIISGLRKERELWGKELAQQGATLSSERGSLEARIEALTEEGRTLRSQLNTEIDTVKIKAKLVADLTETVSQLKQKLSQSEGACDEKEKQLQNIKREHEEELESERSHSVNLEADVAALRSRKEELRSRLTEVEAELEAITETHRNLKAKWQSKSSSISLLEDQVKKMKDCWVEKENKLTSERDKAIEAADRALKKLRAADDGFRQQLEAKEKSYAERIREISEGYELRIVEEEHKVSVVEQEMRELLQEKENSKKQFDEKLQRVTKAFMDLQQDIKGP